MDRAERSLDAVVSSPADALRAGSTNAAETRPTGGVERPLVALVGNPNTGKTTIFNALTGARARVGNYPGVTVERRLGRMTLDGATGEVELLDLPGTYSLSARSREEQIAMEAVLGIETNREPRLTVAVVDAGQLGRNLYLVLQLIELEVPLVVALNMIDEVAQPPDVRALGAWLGVDVVPTCARTGKGIDELRRVVAAALQKPTPSAPHSRIRVAYPDALLADLDEVVEVLPPQWRRGRSSGAGVQDSRGTIGRDRALALWAISSIDDGDELAGIPAELRARCMAIHERNPDRDIDLEIVAARYEVLDAELPSPSIDREAPARKLTERVDAVVLHPVLGFAVFVGLMLLLFQSLFSWSDPAISLIERGVAWLQAEVVAALPQGFFTSLLVEGILGGVGNVIVFLPQILLLFFLLGILEDSGYMARAAYLMDRIMRSLGLHGRAFVPMLSGCACAIPAIMATRTMERERDRILTMLVIPLMTCSARLPVYTLIIASLFPPSDVFGLLPVQGLLMVFMYLFSLLAALGAAGVLGRTVVRGRRMPLLLELPPYRLPTLKSLLRQTLERGGVFLKEAGTVILACTIALWALLSFPEPDSPRPPSQRAVAGWHATATGASARAIDATVVERGDNSAAVAAWRAEKLQGSFGARVGKTVEPLLEPLGFDWRLGVGLIGAFAAREVFVSTMGLVYGIGEADEQSMPLRDKIRTERRADGKPVYTPLVGMSLMIFFALACQCMSTLAVVRRETRSWKWPAFLFAYMTALAYAASFLVYQGGKLLGLS